MQLFLFAYAAVACIAEVYAAMVYIAEAPVAAACIAEVYAAMVYIAEAPAAVACIAGVYAAAACMKLFLRDGLQNLEQHHEA